MKTIPFNRLQSVWKAAAIVLVVLTAGLYLYDFFSQAAPEPVSLMAGREVINDTLPDGTQVFLNRQTQLSYVHNRKANVHTTRLAGEAYFTVRHGNDKTFIIEAGGTYIRDIGTSFNVKADSGSAIVEVIVDEGEVVFYTEQDAGIHLRAGEQGTYDKSSGEFSRAIPKANATAYTTRSFTFQNHTLEEVVESLNAVYDRKIRIDPAISRCKLTVSFKDEAPEEIAAVIAETLGLSVTKEGNTLLLKGSGCGTPQE